MRRFVVFVVLVALTGFLLSKASSWAVTRDARSAVEAVLRLQEERSERNEVAIGLGEIKNQ
jgi:hypothetical protein